MVPWSQLYGENFNGVQEGLKVLALTYDDGPNDPARIFGPGMSTIRARSGASARIRRRRSMHEGMSPWAKERRKTSTPAFMRSLMTSSLSEAGPMVATIRVRRTVFPSSLWTSLMGTDSAVRW